jgi:hypothetical protein
MAEDRAFDEFRKGLVQKQAAFMKRRWLAVLQLISASVRAWILVVRPPRERPIA